MTNQRALMMRMTAFAACLITGLSWLSGPPGVRAQNAAEPVAVEPAEVRADRAEIVKVDRAEQAIEPRVADLAQARVNLHDPQFLLLRSYARVNAALARRTCQLSQTEEVQLALLDDSWLARQISEARDSPIKNMAAGIARFLQGRAVQRAEPRPENQRIVMDRVKRAVDAHIDQALSEAHRTQFRSACASRQKFRTESLACVLVAALDRRLFLTTEQRQQLQTEIARWLKKDLYWQFYFQNQNYIPDIPKPVLSKVLTAEQLASLQGAHAWLYELAQAEMQLVQEEPLLIER